MKHNNKVFHRGGAAPTQDHGQHWSSRIRGGSGTGLSLLGAALLAVWAPAEPAAAGSITQTGERPTLLVMDVDDDGTYDFAAATKRTTQFNVQPSCDDGEVPSGAYWVAMGDVGTTWHTTALTGQTFQPGSNPGVPALMQLPENDNPALQFPQHIHEAAVQFCNSKSNQYDLEDGRKFFNIPLGGVLAGAKCVSEPGPNPLPNAELVGGILWCIATVGACAAGGPNASGMGIDAVGGDIRFDVDCADLGGAPEPGGNTPTPVGEKDPDTYNKNEPVKANLSVFPSNYEGQCPVNLALISQIDTLFKDDFEYWIESTEGWQSNVATAKPDTKHYDFWRATIYNDALSVPIVRPSGGGSGGGAVGTGASGDKATPPGGGGGGGLPAGPGQFATPPTASNLHKFSLRVVMRVNKQTLASDWEQVSVRCTPKPNEGLAGDGKATPTLPPVQGGRPPLGVTGLGQGGQSLPGGKPVPQPGGFKPPQIPPSRVVIGKPTAPETGKPTPTVKTAPVGQTRPTPPTGKPTPPTSVRPTVVAALHPDVVINTITRTGPRKIVVSVGNVGAAAAKSCSVKATVQRRNKTTTHTAQGGDIAAGGGKRLSLTVPTLPRIKKLTAKVRCANEPAKNAGNNSATM